MNTLCPSQCATGFTLTPIKPSGCDLVERLDCVRAIGFYKCNVALPNPLTGSNIEPLMTGPSPELVFSNPLSEVTFSDPQTVERQIADCYPGVEKVISREVTFKDKIAVDFAPDGTPAPFADYAFWKNKKQFSSRLNYVFVMCSGNLIIPREPNSNIGMAASFSITRNFEKSDSTCYEFKAGKLKFLGDPLDFEVPQLNLNSVPALVGLW